MPLFNPIQTNNMFSQNSEGVNQNSKNDSTLITSTFINIYPNPFDEFFTISVSKNFLSNDAIIQIFDSQGKLILNESLVSTQKIVSFNQFSSGIYLVKVSGNGKTEVKTVIKN